MTGNDEFERLKREALMNQGKNGSSDLPQMFIPNTLFAFFGGIIAAYYMFRMFKGVLNSVKVFCMGRATAGAVDYKKLGKWAVVTGATDGIGKAYAEELADEGLNVVLISRTQSKLDQVAADIQKNSNVETKTYAADFTRTDIYEGLQEFLKDLDIGVLVNNVGMGYTHPDDFQKIEVPQQIDLLNINCLSVLRMMSTVLPGMLQRKRGAIINISSYSGLAPTPLLAIYGASKSFVDHLSRAVSTELLYSNHSVIVQSVTPLFVRTKLAGIRKSSFFVPEPTQFVQQALNTVGVYDHTYGCLQHELQAALANLLPAFVLRILTYRQLAGARKGFFKKQARLQQQQQQESEGDKKSN